MSSQLLVDKILPVDGVPAGGGGGIIQITQTTNETTTNLTDGGNTNWHATTFSHSITPKVAGSKILVRCMSSFYMDSDDNTAGATLYRDVAGGGYGRCDPGSAHGLNPMYIFTDGGAEDFQCPISISWLDSPSYTLGQTITYKLYYRSDKTNNKLNGLRTGTQVFQTFEVCT